MLVVRRLFDELVLADFEELLPIARQQGGLIFIDQLLHLKIADLLVAESAEVAAKETAVNNQP